MRLRNVLETLDPEREGLVVLDVEKKKQVHEVLIEMLADFDDICLRYNIKWCLAGGSILGAVRHNGFIPWDDDVDIHIPRKEYVKLLQVFENNDDSIVKRYELYSPGDNNYLFHFPKLFKKGTKFRGIQSTDESPNGFFIDIFILEDTYDNMCCRLIHSIQCNFYLLAVSSMRTKACEQTVLRYTKGNKTAQREIKKRSKISIFFSFQSLQWWLSRMDSCFQKVQKPSSKLVVVPSGAAHYLHELYPREMMCENYKRVKFEKLFLPIPSEAEIILKMRYGEDYMKVPEENEREQHAIIEMQL